MHSLSDVIDMSARLSNYQHLQRERPDRRHVLQFHGDGTAPQNKQQSNLTNR
jgi:hypothetical protein